MSESTGPAWLDTLIDEFGAPGAGLAIALENLFPPLPSEVILPLAGFAASTGRMNLYAALLWTTAGSVIGALALYGVGAGLGRERLLRLVDRLPLVRTEDVERAEAWFARHGDKAVLLGRMVPLVRSLISVPAGLTRMPLPRFLCLTALGSAVWNTVFVLAGYALGAQWSRVSDLVSAYSTLVLVLAVGAAALFVGLRVISPGRGRRRSGSDRVSARPRPPRSPRGR